MNRTLMILKWFAEHQNHLVGGGGGSGGWGGGACQTSLLLPTPGISESAALGWVLRIGVSNKFLDAVAAAG